MRWYRGHLAGGADFSGIDQSERSGRGQHGGNRQPRSEEHTSELQSHSDLHSFPTRRSSDLSALQTSQRAGHDYVLGEALKTWQWWALWMLLFLNTCAGIAVISQEAPIFQELTKVSAVVAGSMVGIASLDRKSTRLNSSHTVIYTLSLHDALPI